MIWQLLRLFRCSTKAFRTPARNHSWMLPYNRDFLLLLNHHQCPRLFQQSLPVAPSQLVRLQRALRPLQRLKTHQSNHFNNHHYLNKKLKSLLKEQVQNNHSHQLKLNLNLREKELMERIKLQRMSLLSLIYKNRNRSNVNFLEAASKHFPSTKIKTWSSFKCLKNKQRCHRCNTGLFCKLRSAMCS